jgi:hypothetical protein
MQVSKKVVVGAVVTTAVVVGLYLVLKRVAPTFFDITEIGARAALDASRRAIFGPTKAAALDENDARKAA